MTTTTSNIEKNKKIAIQFLTCVSDGNIEQMCKMITPNWRMHGGPPNLPEGAEGIKTLFIHLNNVQQKWTIEDVIAEGNKVVTRATNTCVQDSFFGINAAGITQKFTAMFIHKITNGKIEETWRNANDLSRLLQIGAKFGNGIQIDNN